MKTMAQKQPLWLSWIEIYIKKMLFHCKIGRWFHIPVKYGMYYMTVIIIVLIITAIYLKGDFKLFDFNPKNPNITRQE
jgi:hypothetical protein